MSAAVVIPQALPVWRDPAAWSKHADLVAVLIAVSLPWSTSLVGIFGAVLLVAIAPTLDFRLFLQSLKRPISALPIALFVLALVGTLWSDAPWGTRSYALSPVTKLLVLPLLFYHFERSTRGMWVFVGFLGSCTLLLVLSYGVAFDPRLALKADAYYGVPVKNYIDQSQEFGLCAVSLTHPIVTFVRQRKFALAAVLALLALSFLANLVFVVTSRTALIAIPVMFLTYVLLHLRWQGRIVTLCMLAVLFSAAWFASPRLQEKIASGFSQYDQYKEFKQATSVGLRLEFWRKSLGFFAEAPLIGHGTGATRRLFEQAAIGQIGAAAEVIGNPHNQTLNVAIQWGAFGVLVLYMMWLVHLRIFRGDDLANWVGLLVVMQNIVTSLFNSHLFDFHEGWMYVLGVGVAGGMARQVGGSEITATPTNPRKP